MDRMTDTPSIPRPAQPCITCGTPTTNPKQRCTTHLKQHTQKHNQDHAYYHTKHWKQLAALAKQAAHHQCELCSTPAEQTRLMAHHRIARKNGGADALHNLVVLCHSCHSRIERGDTYTQDLLDSYMRTVRPND